MKRRWDPVSAMFAVTAAIAGAAAFLLRSRSERRHLSVREEEAAFPNLPEAFDGYRIAFLSDLHGNGFGTAGADLLAAAVENARPDLILCGGDSVVAKDGKALCADVSVLLFDRLRNLGVPMYTGLGNHELRMKEYPGRYEVPWEAYVEACRTAGAEILDDQTVLLRRGGDSLYVTGLTLTREFYRTFSKAPMPAGWIAGRIGERKGFTVLLMHSPLYFPEAASWGADLVLSGHVHGGTIRLPGIGGLMTPNFMFFPKYDRGRYELGNSRMYVSAGLGTHSIDLRFLNPPELYLITLRRRGDA